MIQLTRYLYIKDEVKLALLLSILDKKEESIFWAYEIYYSSNESNEIFDILWQIYYDFFAILNPSFESYFLIKQNKFDKKLLISMIVQDLLIRPFNTDGFILKLFHLHYQNPLPLYNMKDFIQFILEKDFINIANFILTNHSPLTSIYEICLQQLQVTNACILIKQFTKIISNLQEIICPKYILLVKILSLFYETNKNNKKKSFYIQVKQEEIILYNLDYDVSPYKILNFACIFKINDYKYFSLFDLERHALTYSELKYLYHNDWLFYASFSSIWDKRICLYEGTKDLQKKQIIFTDIEKEELFFDTFDYEPDEQSLELKNKTIPEFYKKPNDKEINWNSFVKDYNKKGCILFKENDLNKLLKIKIIY